MKTLIVGIIVICAIAYIANKIIKLRMENNE